MIAIAESGSTKCDWIILNDQREVTMTARTPGFNPYFHNRQFILKELSQCPELVVLKEDITSIFFYGAGCSSDELNEVVKSALQQFFTKANVAVDHDLVAAAYSLYSGEPIISCIIGTGSNSCFFDGIETKELVPALGFILGDEASGSYFGKKILADYFYQRLPHEMQRDFENRFPLKWTHAIEKVYQNPHANVYLASFMKFIADHKENPYITEMIREGMARFIDIHVTNFMEYHRYEVGFVGTVAYVFKEILIEELQKRDCKVGPIIKSPIDNLVRYHVEHKLQNVPTA